MPEGLLVSISHDDAMEREGQAGSRLTTARGKCWRFRKSRSATPCRNFPKTSAADGRIARMARRPCRGGAVAAAARSRRRQRVDETLIPAAAGHAAERRRAMARGTAAHRLMQSLPRYPARSARGERRRNTSRGETISTRTGPRPFEARCSAILDDARFAPLFAAGSRAEVPIVGTLYGGRVRVVRPGGPPGGDAGGRADRRLQNEPPRRRAALRGR